MNRVLFGVHAYVVAACLAMCASGCSGDAMHSNSLDCISGDAFVGRWRFDSRSEYFSIYLELKRDGSAFYGVGVPASRTWISKFNTREMKWWSLSGVIFLQDRDRILKIPVLSINHESMELDLTTGFGGGEGGVC